MKDLLIVIEKACSGDLESFGRLIMHFQDMAYAYSYSLLGDFHLAKDASQEAFLDAHQHLSSLRAPKAFPAWFRRIVFKHCDRLTRGKKLPTVPLEAVAEQTDSMPRPDEALNKDEMRRFVRSALQALPQEQRTVATLFYIRGYSQIEVANFLDLPTTTVNNRLYSARRRLKEGMVNMLQNELANNALPKQEFCSIILDKLSKKQASVMTGSPINQFADVVITQAMLDNYKRLTVSLDENGTVCLKGFESGEWKEWAPPPARIIPALLTFLAAAATTDADSEKLEASLPFEKNGEKHNAKIEVKNITVSITLPGSE